MTVECEISDQTAQATLSIRSRASVADLPALMGRALGAIIQYLGDEGQSPIGPPYAAYYNQDMQDLDVEIGFPVAGTLPGKDTIEPGLIPATKVASCVHVGPYDQLQQTYATLTAFMVDRGLRPTGVAYEFYLSDPGEVPPVRLQTQIVFPLT